LINKSEEIEMSNKAVIIVAGISRLLTGLLLLPHFWKITIDKAKLIEADNCTSKALGIRQ